MRPFWVETSEYKIYTQFRLISSYRCEGISHPNTLMLIAAETANVDAEWKEH